MNDNDRRITVCQHVYTDTAIEHHILKTNPCKPAITIGENSLVFEDAAALSKLANAANQALAAAANQALAALDQQN